MKIRFNKNIQIEIIDNIVSFSSIKSEWNSLLSDTFFSKSIFQTFEWNYAWWEFFGKNNDLFILTIRFKNKLIGIIPFYIENQLKLKFLKTKNLKFLGSGPSDILDIIADKKYYKEVIKYFFMTLKLMKNKWDNIEIDEVPNISYSHFIFKKLSSHIPYTFKSTEQSRSAYLNLPNDFNSFNMNLSKKSRKNFRRELRSLEANFDVKLIISDDYNSDCYESFIKLNLKRFKQKGIPSPFESSNFRDFHKLLSKTSFESSSVCFFTLYLDDIPVSSLYCFLHNNNIYYYQIGYDPQYQDYSVGRVIIYLAIKESINRRFSQFNFLRGLEDYKMRFKPKNYTNYKLYFEKSLKERLKIA